MGVIRCLNPNGKMRFLGYYCKCLNTKTSNSVTASSISLRFMSSAATIVDLRSDTLTKPTQRMREAMRNAEVGDDVFREDPTVNKLQEASASILGKEAALLVPTCTMANIAAVLVHCNGRFNEIILGEESHMHLYEVAGIAQFAGIQGNCVPNLADGTMELRKIEEKIRPLDDDHQPWTRLICVENTQNRCGGKVIQLDYLKQVNELARRNNLLLHLDGARLFNAATALNVEAKEITQYFDTVSIAFSKGLCCPLGSLLAGPKDFIDLARRARKALGGGMRQAGVVAAPMLLGLEEMVSRLGEDHNRARTIAQGIDSMGDNPVCSVDMDGVQSNIVMIDMKGKVTVDQFVARMKEVRDKERKQLGTSVSVLMLPFSATRVRYVTHNDVSDDHVTKAVTKIQYVIDEFSSV